MLLQATGKFLAGILLTGMLLFIPAGTVHYWNAWVLIGVLFGPMLIAGICMSIYSPDLLKKRLDGKEEESEQKVVVALSGMMFIAAFIAAGLDFRFGLTDMPEAIVWVAAGILLISYLMYAEVMRENAYLSRTVGVQDGQKVIDSGLYGIVRHPMYSATIFLFLSMPLILGSLISFIIMLAYIPIINVRMKNEEQVLAEGLPGYKEYMQKVKYRIIPYIW